MPINPLSVFLLGLTATAAQNALIIQQSGTLGDAVFSLIDTQNDVLITKSNLSIPYQRPYIEATATEDGSYYVVAFPSDDPNFASHLYYLDSGLHLTKEWAQPADGLSFFDLQYGAEQSQLYGIAVNGTYGRVVSKLDISGDEVTASYISACPYMWYVNASSFDQENSVYWALLNNFKDPTLGQKIMTVNVATAETHVYDYDSLTYPLLYYIAYVPDTTTSGATTSAGNVYVMGSDLSSGAAVLGSLVLDNGASSATFKASPYFSNNYDIEGSPLGKLSPLFKGGEYGYVCVALGKEGETSTPDLYCEEGNGGSLYASPMSVTAVGNVQAATDFGVGQP